MGRDKALKETVEVFDVTKGALQVNLEESLVESMFSSNQAFSKAEKQVLFLYPNLNLREHSLFKIIQYVKLVEGVANDATTIS